jgi:hypothetical protein
VRQLKIQKELDHIVQKQFMSSLLEGASGKKADYLSCHHVAGLARQNIVLHTSLTLSAL